MPMSLDEIYTETQALTNDAKAVLAEKLVASIEGDIDPEISKIHLAEVLERREAIRSGRVLAVNGEEGLAQIRAMLK